MTRYELRFYTPTGAYLGSTSQFFSLDYTRRENYVTWMTTELPHDFFDGRRSAWLTARTRIALYRSHDDEPERLVGGSIWFLLDWDRIREGVEKKIIIRAASANWLLGSRIVAYAASSAQSDKDGEVDAIAKDIVAENFGASATDTDRDISTYLEIADDLTGETPNVEMAFAYRNVADVLDKLSGQAAEDGTVWLYDIVPANGDPGAALRFETYVGLQGVSRDLILSAEQRNYSRAELHDIYSNEANAIYVGGRGVDSERLIISGKTTAADIDPFARREEFRSEPRLSLSTSLTDVRDAFLGLRQARRTFEATIEQTPGSRYMLDWDFGDEVRWEFDDDSGTARVAAVAVSVEDGREDIRCVLNDGYPIGRNTIRSTTATVPGGGTSFPILDDPAPEERAVSGALRAAQAVTTSDSTLTPKIVFGSVTDDYAVIDAFSADAEVGTVTGTQTITKAGGGNWANAHAIDANIIIPPSELTSRYFGMSTSATSAQNATRLQTAIDEAIASMNRLTLLPGAYSIDSQISISDAAGLRIRGRGGYSNDNTTLTWDGNSSDPMFLIEDSRECHIGGFRIKVASGTPLNTGIKLQNNSGTYTPQRILLHDIHMEPDAASLLTRGVWIADDGSGGDANNDFHELQRVVVRKAERPFWIQGTQSKAIVFNGCFALGDSSSTQDYILYCEGGSFVWIGGGGNRSTEYDFFINNAHDPISIIGANCEHSAAFLWVQGPTAVDVPINVTACRFDRSDGGSAMTLTSGGRIVYVRGPGPVTIQNSRFKCGTGETVYIEQDVGGTSNKHATLAVYDCHVQSSNSAFLTNNEHGRFRARGNGHHDGTTRTVVNGVDYDYDHTRQVFIPAEQMQSGIGTPGLVTVGSAAAKTAAQAYEFTTGADESAYFLWSIPRGVIGDMVIKARYAMDTSASGDVVFDISVQRVDDGDLITVSDSIVNVNSTDTAPATANEVVTHTMVTSSSSVWGTDNQFVRVYIGRDGTSGSDTHGGDLLLLGIIFEYRANTAL